MSIQSISTRRLSLALEKAAAPVLLFLVFFGVAEAHFALAPKIEIGPARLEHGEQTLLRIQGYAISRRTFHEYLQRLSAFDTKYDRIQPNFYAHFEIIRGLAFFHPDNIHTYIDHIEALKDDPNFYRFALNTWFDKQSEMFSRIRWFYQKALERPDSGNAEVEAVMDFYAAGVKTEFIEELVVLGAMEPTRKGLAEFVRGIPESERKHIDTGIANDTRATPIEEQQRMQKRWAEFRKSALDAQDQTNVCAEIGSPEASPDSRMVQVNRHRVRLKDYLVLFGKPRLAHQWPGMAKANCKRLVLFFTIADLCEDLGIVPARAEKKIEVSRRIYIAAREIVKELGPALIDPEKSVDEQDMARELSAYPEILKLKAQVLQATAKSVSKDGLYIDHEFLSQVPWTLRRMLSPKHSIHF